MVVSFTPGNKISNGKPSPMKVAPLKMRGPPPGSGAEREEREGWREEREGGERVGWREG